jgi:hypothetical protein
VNPDVLASDEAIVAMLAHEASEIRALDEFFEARNFDPVPRQTVADMIRPNAPAANLHDQAWVHAAEAVERFRAPPPSVE